MQGWIKKHRRIMNHWLYEEERVFSKYEAFDYLMMMANHKDNKTMIDGKLMNIERGQMITSIRKLCERWKWSNTKVVQFLETLEEDGMIHKKSDTKKTAVTIVNYGKYQGSDEEETTQERHENDTETIQKHTNKNVKKEKNVKKVKEEVIKTLYGDHVLLTDEQYKKLINDITEIELTRLIDDINYWFTQKPLRIKDYKDHNLMIRKWHKNNLEKKLTVIGGGNDAKSQRSNAGYGTNTGNSQTTSISDDEMDEYFYGRKVSEVQ